MSADLLERQSFIIHEIEKIYINYKKDSPDRKTPEYFRKRLEAIDNLWDEFHQNNQLLMDEKDKSSEYFVKNIYHQTEHYYKSARGNIVTGQTASNIQQPAGTPSTKFGVPVFTPETSDNNKDYLSDLKAQQEANFRALSRQIERIIREDSEEKWEIEDEIKNLQYRWRIIDEKHLRIDSILQGTDKEYEESYAVIEGQYNGIKRELNRKLNSTTHLHQSVPKVEMPIFTGKYEQWPTFYDLYTETIHNNKYLTNAQKMQHLKGKLKGEAERIIQHLHISAENYETAWEILNHRYNNTQLLFTNQVEIFLNQPKLNKQTSYELKKLYDTTTECIHAIHNLGVDTNTWDPLLVHLITKKLDTDTYSDYKESRKQPRELPKLEELMTFIENKFIALEPVQAREKDTPNTGRPKPFFNVRKPFINERPSTHQGYQRYQGKPSHRAFYQAAPTYTRKPCIVCNLFHDLFMCKTFFNLPAMDQLDTISKHKICPNCLYSHYDKPCNSTRRCKDCNEKHNTLIHDAIQSKNKMNTSNTQTTTASSSTPATNQTSSYKPPRQHQANYVATDDEEILLTTIKIEVKAADGSYITLRALLDQGSQVSIISENAVQLLGLQRKSYHATVSGIGPCSKQSKGMVTLECQSIYKDYQFITDALVIPRVINNLPNTSFGKKIWPHLQHLALADPDYNISKPIDLLLDASVYSNIIMEGLLKGAPHAPIAQQTRLGWILSGNVKTFKCNVIINQVNDLSKYWEVEDIQESHNISLLTEQEQYCEDLYQATTRRLDDGRYVVAIPMKTDFKQQLGSSKSKAIGQFVQLERKMAKNKSLSDGYKQFMNEYQNLGHMRKAGERVSETTCYLPHHGVVKLESTTTSLRVVFNASSKTSSGHSLNDLMESGPNLQQDLQSLILKWRLHKYVMTADIEKMFRQIIIRTADQPLQSILWRDTPRELLQEYHLTTVTYGTKAAPFLAMRTLKQIANDNKVQFRHAAYALQNSFYMDDLMCGHDNIEEARILQKELIEVLQGAGMNLRKWSSNEPQLIQHLSPEKLSTMYEFKDTETMKTLGLRWNPVTDMFTYQCKLSDNNNDHITKRQLLSEISKIYDPLGWLSPVTIRGKLLFQRTWLMELSWDNTLSKSIHTEWLQLKEDLKLINTLQVPRYLGQTGQSPQLHGFCDASEKAYAVAIYLVAKNNKGEFTSRLVAAKTKVAPTKKQISLPRLELLGAQLLSRLMKKVLETISPTEIKIHAWTDSMIVLGWIHGDISRWKQFVANRVKDITNVIPSACWQHIRSEENAADCATRGMTTANLSKYSLWWEGPKCILSHEQKQNLSYEEPNIEVKKKENVHAALHSKSESFILNLINKISSITRLAKTVAWVLRFTNRLRNTSNNKTYENILSTAELQNAYNLILQTVQSIEFAEEISSLKKRGHVSSSSKLLDLNPYIDKDGLLRVGGRLGNSNLRYSSKHPIILPALSRVTQLIIDQAHITTLHGGAKLTLSYIRGLYWIVSGVRTVKKQLRNCIKCRRFKQEVGHQIMADLPQQRVTPSRPFTNTGVDFTGHIDIKMNKGRGIRTSKGYVAVFVCLVTKAVHLEVASDLSTDAFLAAFRRMCARRGTPAHVFSDNGTNFVGASRFLKREYNEIINTITTDAINNINEMGVTWHFNAPAWPSAGGLWEAAVKSLKYHLKRVMGEQKLTYEELTTLIQQIEACLNSRPLCSLTESPDDDCLTPGHFLVGGPIISRPQTDPDVVHLSSRWQMVQAMNKQIWKRWSTEYLQQLQTRSKWRTPTQDIQLDDVVIIKEENMAPGKWALGRVTELHTGKDGHTRVVSLKTQNKVMKRPITKLILLPVNKALDDVSSAKNDTENINDDKHSRQLRPRKLHFKNFLIYVLLFFMAAIPSTIQQFVNITQIKGNNSLYFDKTGEMQIVKDQWTMVVYYNMTTYWETVNNLEKYVYNLTNACNNTDTCLAITTQYEHEMNEIRHYNELLLSTHHNHHRSRRGLINALGNVANALFGVLDDKFAEQYNQDIDMIHRNEAHLLKLFKNQTSIIEAENNILYRHEQRMNTQFEIINNHLKSLSKETNFIRNQFYVLSNAMSIGSMISNIRRIQEELIDTVTDIFQGRLDVHILSPDQLKEQLNIISGQINGDLSVPVKPENIRHLYEILHVRAKVKQSYLIIEVKVPLTASGIYELDHVISLPQTIKHKTIYAIPITDYIAFNVRKDTFIPMTQAELLHCISYHQNRLLCGLSAPIYELKIGQSICDIRIITHKSNQTFCKIKPMGCTDLWIKLHPSDAWLYSCCEMCQVRIMCPSSLTSQQLRGSGIITIGRDCAVKGDSFTLLGHHDYRTQIDTQPFIQDIPPPMVSALNEFINTSIPVQLMKTDDEDYNRIKEQIHTLKEATINDVSNHDKHHYVMIYFLLSVIIVLTVCIIYLFYLQKRNRQSNDRGNDTPQQGQSTSAMYRVNNPPASHLYAKPNASDHKGENKLGQVQTMKRTIKFEPLNISD